MFEAISKISGNSVTILKANSRKVTVKSTTGHVWSVTRSYFKHAYVHALWA